MKNDQSSGAANGQQSNYSEERTEGNPAIDFLAGLLPILTPGELTKRSKHLVPIDSQTACVERIARTLYRTVQRHPAIVGERGVGKSTVAMRAGAALVENHYPFLKFPYVLYLDAANVGPEDSRACLETVLQGVAGNEVSRLLIIDGFTSLLKRGGGGNNKSLIRSMLERPHLSVAPIVDRRDYTELIANDFQLAPFFERVDVEEPCGDELQRIVRSVAKDVSKEQKLEICEEVCQSAISLTSAFILSENQPSKSIDALRRAAEDKAFAVLQRNTQEEALTPADVISVIAERTKIPADAIAGNDRQRNYETTLARSILGQEEATKQVAIELELIAAGLNEPNKPASVLMFAGTTGVGKTELAKRVAELYSSSGLLKVYPMGNFTESHSVSGLLGVPPGYVGHEEGGRIVSDLLADPYSVFLLDEAEKCHPNVWKPFLNLFDEGWIVDQQGRKAYADRAIFILTTNAGDRNISQLTRKGKSQEEIAQQVRKTLSRVRQERSSQPVFPPQFLSRMRKIIVFNPLSEQDMIGIAQRIMATTCARWASHRHKSLIVDDEVIAKIGSRGHTLNQDVGGEEGGRIVTKLIREKIEYPVLERVLEDPERYRQSSRVIISAETGVDLDEEIAVDFVS